MQWELRYTIAAPLGMINDEPSACTTRHNTSNSTLGDSAAATDAAVKRPVPASKACRAPDRRASEAPITKRGGTDDGEDVDGPRQCRRGGAGESGSPIWA